MQHSIKKKKNPKQKQRPIKKKGKKNKGHNLKFKKADLYFKTTTLRP